ncbi:hypothetical protein [Streptomyces sp. NPDC093094]|uniref:hypothetical protein n=1 Tax=Streptomyces sp. NPDC093094 TaxID=3366026 RepID=UPI00380240D8
MTTTAATAFDRAERRMWAGRADAYGSTFARLCAHPVPALLDAAAVGAGTYVLDAGTVAGIRTAYDRLAAAEYTDGDELVLEHGALLAHATA